jgi:hypothetical protein
MTFRNFLGKARRKIFRLFLGKNLYADAGQVNRHEKLIHEQTDRINLLENRIAGQNNIINEQRGRIDHLFWLSWYRVQKYAPESKYPEILCDWYHEFTGKKLGLNNPRTFNEKIQWLKLYDSTPLKTRLADKYLVRDWIKEKIGEEYLIPLLGVYDNFDEIDFDTLPNQFVLKANHGSTWNIIVKDKTQFDKEKAKRDMDYWMRINFAFYAGMELQYRDIAPKIIAEQYLEDDGGQLSDYKFYCFNGKPEYILVITDRFSQEKMNIYDMQWNLTPIHILPGIPDLITFNKPKEADRLIELTNILCKDFKNFGHIRFDFYIADGKVYFGEITFTAGSGVYIFDPPEYDNIWGDLIKLPLKA